MAFQKPVFLSIRWAALALLILAGCRSQSSAPSAVAAPCEPGRVDFSLFLAGDSLIVEPWSGVEDPEFIKLVDQIRSADAAITNLETVIHEFKGYPQAISGGTHMASPPRIAYELAWAGFDMVAHANNHTFDYGSIGVLETLDNVRKAGLVLAGSGKDLKHAREPGFFQGPGGTVGLVATAATFVPFGLAGASRPELHGRPGLNPFRVSFRKTVPFTGPIGITIPTSAQINPEDLEANLDSIRSARKKADIVVFSIHAHGKGLWLSDLAHRVIDAGADVFFTHGPHETRGIEIYHCRPIFYGLGDFVFEQERIRRLPPESYESHGLKGDATWEELQEKREKRNSDRLSSYDRWPAFEGLGAVVRFKMDGNPDVRLIPVDLGYGKPLPVYGRPKLADPQMGRKIIGGMNDKSKPFNTSIRYNDSDNTGVISIPQAP